MSTLRHFSTAPSRDSAVIVGQTAEIADVVPTAVRKLPPAPTATIPQTDAHAEPVVAIAHDYLTQRGGAERVVLAMLRAFPNAKLYTTLYDPDGTFPEFKDADIVVSPLNRIGALRRHHRRALPFLAMASSRVHIPADVVIASSSGWAHGFRSSGRMIVYCHTPARWLYLNDEYLGGDKKLSLKRAVLSVLTPALTWWDGRAAARADRYLANATGVRERIRRVYGRDADVVFPPHSIDAQGAQEAVPGLEEFASGSEYFLLVSRLLPYKNVAEAIDAFRNSGHRLVVVGAGPMRDALLQNLPRNVRLVSDVSEEQLRWLYSGSAALIAPAHEDLGLTVLEAAAWGKPSIALHAGGYLDTVIEGVTGYFFPVPSADAIRQAVSEFRSHDWDAEVIRGHAATFSEHRFGAALATQVREVLALSRHPGVEVDKKTGIGLSVALGGRS